MRHRSCAWLVSLLMLAACGARAQSHVTADELLAAIQAGESPVIVDVRSQGEYDSGHVPGARHIPFYSLFVRAGEIQAGPDDPVVIYCEHGPRAGMAKVGLRLAGFSQVRYLDGHMSRWKERGLPMETSAP